jgi:Brp/Blh family beta-carotene 15,15'-monooxygenase
MAAEARRIQTAVALILTAGLLAVIGLLMPVSAGIQIATVGLSVLVFGIPHGAMDHRVAEWVLRDRLQQRWAPVFAATYCGLALLMLLIWRLAPVAALVIFLILGAFHFGLGDIESPKKKLGRGTLLLFAFTRGVLPIALPIVFHRAEVTTLFGWLMPQPAGATLLPMSLIYPAAVSLVVASFLVQLAHCLVNRNPGEIGELLLLALVASILPPLIGFAVYFGLWHSPRHIIELASWRVRQLPGDPLDTGRDVLSFKTGLRQVALEAIPLTLLTWVMMAAAFALAARSSSVDATTVRVIFISLSALTVPHMLLTAAAGGKSDSRPRTLAIGMRSEAG